MDVSKDTSSELNIEKFSPSVAEVRSIVAKTEDITLDDPENKQQLAVVKENRLALKGIRGKITKYGKVRRETL